MNLKNRCIICGSNDNLNTSMKMTVEPNSYEISLCDKHADDTTSRQIKEAIQNKIKEFESLKVKIAEFGIVISEEMRDGGKVIPQQRSPNTESKIMKPASTSMPKYRLPATQSGEAEAYSEIDPGNVIEAVVERAKTAGKIDKDAKINVPRVEEVDMQTVNSRGGAMSLPKKIKSSDGSITSIIFVKTTDAELQSRIRQVAAAPDGHSFSKGYKITECPLCGGTGFARANGAECPKCKGKGSL